MMQCRVKQCVIVILAAGESSRMGRPKQLLLYNNKSLLMHSVHEAMQTGLPVIVVTGANIDVITNELKSLGITIAENKKWNEGIASSLRCGLETTVKLIENLDGIIFMVCDQPFISTILLEDLLKTQRETAFPIVASDYGGVAGTPVLFHKSFFSELLKLTGDTGARNLIKQNASQLKSIPFLKGNIDIDTKEDYEALLG